MKTKNFTLILLSSLLFASKTMMAESKNGCVPEFTSTGIQGDFLGIRFPTTGSKWPFPTGSVWLHFSTSFILGGYPTFGTKSSFLPILGAAEISIDPHWAVGPYLGYYSINFSDSYLGESYSSNLKTFVFGGRITLHGADLLRKHMGADIDLKKWDIYGTLSAGMVVKNWAVESRFKETQNYDSSLFPSFGLMIGVKYFAYSTFAIHGEVGKGPFGFINFGISYWLK